MSDHAIPSGPDFAAGVPLASLGHATIVEGRVGDTAVLLVLLESGWAAVGAHCTHYSAPLKDGVIVGDTIHCPWHHACFNLRTGGVVSPPALNRLPRWHIEVLDGVLFVREPIPEPVAAFEPVGTKPKHELQRIIIVGAGAAGSAAVETLRGEGYAGSITIIDSDGDAPYDRPNLSKDYLAGTAPEEWMPLRTADFYSQHGIHLLRGRKVVSLHTAERDVILDDGSHHHYDALLLATGATPVMLPPHLSSPSVHYLRTLADSRRIRAAAATAHSAIVIGSSFIGLETAAALRARGIEVTVVSPDEKPLAKVMGDDIAAFIRALHEEHGVRFRLRQSVKGVVGNTVTLDDDSTLTADLIIAGIGVRPNIEIAERAGLSCDKGILVDEYLETSAPGIYAAGDVARWQRMGHGRARVEHWVHAERQGQAAARNMRGAHLPFTAVPFFWSQHYDVAINYVGLAPEWDKTVMAGSIENQNCAVSFYDNGERVAVATIGRDRESLAAEISMEQDNRAAFHPKHH